MEGGLEFQFQYGSIKSFLSSISARSYQCFNSNMVRLKDAKAEGKNADIESFNSNMVRLKGLQNISGDLRDGVSIPIWFD